MSTLTVSLEQQGRLVPVGELTGDRPESARFRYRGEYLRNPSAAAAASSPGGLCPGNGDSGCAEV